MVTLLCMYVICASISVRFELHSKLNQEACAFFGLILSSHTTEFNDVFEACIQFQRDLYELGIPFNSTNARGLYGF